MRVEITAIIVLFITLTVVGIKWGQVGNEALLLRQELAAEKVVNENLRTLSKKDKERIDSLEQGVELVECINERSQALKVIRNMKRNGWGL